MTPPAPDPLLHLSLEALTQLTNVGLVKRAQREVAAGALPRLLRADDGSLQAEFADGVRTVFAAGAGVADARCSCGAAQCRHRLIVVLSWQRQAADTAPAPAPPRSPGAIDDGALLAWSGATAWAQAERIRNGGLLIDVRRADASDPVPTAALPQATVRFHGGADPAAAQSDAAISDHRASVVLGVWAFREADQRAADEPRVRVQLGARAVDSTALAQAQARLLAGLLRHGLAAGSARHAPALTEALQLARKLGATWVLLALGDLEAWLAAYAERSARFRAEDGVALLGELALRMRAARGNGELAAQHVLGVGERLETPMARVRLRALGMRIRGDGEHRRARVALFDPDTSSRLALTCSWENASTTGAASVARAAGVRVGGSVPLGALAHGQLVTVSAHRRADGELRLGAGHGGRTSLLGQSADWSDLPTALVHTRIADWRESQRHLPPSALGPRHALAGHLLFAPREVAEVGFDPATQSIYAALIDADAQTLLLSRPYERAAPGALDALARVLSAAGGVRHVAGVVRDDGALPELDPWALSDGQTLTIPDLANADGSVRDLPIGTLPALSDPLAQALARASDWLAERLLGGPGTPRWVARGRELAGALERVGLTDLALAIVALGAGVDHALPDAEDHSLAQRATTLLIGLALSHHELSRLHPLSESAA